jgi:hypothetical protein
MLCTQGHSTLFRSIWNGGNRLRVACFGQALYLQAILIRLLEDAQNRIPKTQQVNKNEEGRARIETHRTALKNTDDPILSCDTIVARL